MQKGLFILSAAVLFGLSLQQANAQTTTLTYYR